MWPWSLRRGCRKENVIVRPTKEQLAKSYDKTIRDVLAPGLDVVFCGINPGRYSGATGFHFAGPGNRFWPALFASGLTDRLLLPSEVRLLPNYGLGITNLVARTTARADELDDDELREGLTRLVRKVKKYQPKWVAVVGLGAYRVGFDKPDAKVGPQKEQLAGANVWVLPSTSGLNASCRPAEFAKQFKALRRAAQK